MSCGAPLPGIVHFGCCGTNQPVGRQVMGMSLYWSNYDGNRDGEHRFFEQDRLTSMIQQMQDFLGALDYSGTACEFDTVFGRRSLGANATNTIPEWTWSPNASLPQSVTNAPVYPRLCQAQQSSRGDQLISVFRLKFWCLENTEFCHRIRYSDVNGTVTELARLERTRPIIFFPALVPVPGLPAAGTVNNSRIEFAEENPAPGSCH